MSAETASPERADVLNNEDPFGPFPRVTGWRAAPDCGKCFDTGRFRWANGHGGTTEGHCSCKRGRRMSEVWRAEKDGQDHPDAPVQEEPDWDAGR